MKSNSRLFSFLLIAALIITCRIQKPAHCEEPFIVSRIGNINSYADNAFRITASEDGLLTIRIHDNICIYRTITERINAGETVIHWDGCGYNQEKLYEKTYNVSAELETDTGRQYSVSFISPIEYPAQFLQYALPSSDSLYLDNPNEWFLEYKTVKDGQICVELYTQNLTDPVYSYKITTSGGKIGKKEFSAFSGKNKPEPGNYSVQVYELSRPEQKYVYSLHVLKSSPDKPTVTVTGEIMPDRSMSDNEIWEMMMQPSVVADIDFFKHQDIFTEPDEHSISLGTIHGQTQGLKVIRIQDEWAMVGAWNHEEASYVEGWVPLSILKTEYPEQEYGILIDKKSQTLSVYQNGKRIDTLLVSTGKAEEKRLYQETSAGCFLTGYHRVNFSMNGKKYDYVIQYDGGNLLHQTPYEWGQHKKDFTYGRGSLGAKASHACIRIQPEPGEGGLNAYWLFTHLPYHTRVIILDDKEEREAVTNKLKRSETEDHDFTILHFETDLQTRYDESVEITFGGCLIPGGSKTFNNRKDSLVSFVQKSGYQTPLASLRHIFENDDLTCLNLCAPILGEEVQYPDIKSLSYAPAGMEKILENMSVELLHMTDDRFLPAGEKETKNTVNKIMPYAAVLECGKTCTVSLKGCLIGFAGCTEKEYLKDPDLIDERILALKEQNCKRIIFLCSWGDSQSNNHSIVQEAMAHRCVRAGADLVVGSQQGLVQGIDMIEGVPVIYSLGDLLIGSSAGKPRSQQGMLIRASFSASEDEVPVSITVIPILPYGNLQKDRNDYVPSAELSEQQAQTIIRRVWKDTADQIMDRIVFYTE